MANNPWKRAAPATLAALLSLPASPAQAQDRWDRAEQEVRRLPPTAFVDLPDTVRAELERRACRIPQLWYRDEPHNVIRGRFAAPYQEDVAVLCSRDGTSLLLVFWGGPVRCEGVLAETPDRDWLQGVGGDEIGYSRSIAAVGREYIERMHAAFGGPEPPRITHEGINEAFDGKASSVLYCHHGRWLRLTGMD